MEDKEKILGCTRFLKKYIQAGFLYMKICPVLFTSGNLPDESKKTVAIVGA